MFRVTAPPKPQTPGPSRPIPLVLLVDRPDGKPPKMEDFRGLEYQQMRP